MYHNSNDPELRSPPGQVECGNGPQLVANALRDELQAVEDFTGLLEAQ
jgi:hypothetical protein